MRDYLDVPFEVKAVSDDGLFSGYGSVFGVLDSYKEVVAPGAFSESLQGRMPALLWQHRAGEPIGVYTAVREDAVGLYVEGKLALKTARGAEAYELLKMRALSGLSIGFVTREDSYDKVAGVRWFKTGVGADSETFFVGFDPAPVIGNANVVPEPSTVGLLGLALTLAFIVFGNQGSLRGASTLRSTGKIGQKLKI